MKNRRSVPRKRKSKHRTMDSVDALLQRSLAGGKYAPFFCGEHGLHHMLSEGTRPNCPICNKPCFTPEEWQYAADQRKRRERRVQLLRNHLE